MYWVKMWPFYMCRDIVQFLFCWWAKIEIIINDLAVIYLKGLGPQIIRTFFFSETPIHSERNREKLRDSLLDYVVIRKAKTVLIWIHSLQWIIQVRFRIHVVDSWWLNMKILGFVGDSFHQRLFCSNIQSWSSIVWLLRYMIF